MVILEKELSSAQTRIAQLEQLARSLEKDKDELQVSLRDHQRALAEKEDQLQELLGEWDLEIPIFGLPFNQQKKHACSLVIIFYEILK